MDDVVKVMLDCRIGHVGPTINTMADGGFKAGGTLGGKVGCVVAAAFGLPLLTFIFLDAALSDCVPNEPCNQWVLLVLLVPAVLVPTIMGFAVRGLTNWLAARVSK